LRSGPSRSLSRRSFVSSVLLSKSWDSETLSDIKKELKKRGLLRTGNKATLITRITEHDHRKQLELLSGSSAPDQLCHASTGSTPGIPASSEATPYFPVEYLAAKLPDLSQPFPEPPVQIPFVPDHWESSKAKPQVDSSESTTPKISTVTHAATHPGGGPSHNLYQMSEHAHPLDSNKPSTSSSKAGLWSDVVNDLGLPTSVKAPTVQWQFSETPAKSTVAPKRYSRKLDSDEVRGVWMLLGLVAGSWILAGAVKPTSELEHAEKHT